MGNLHVSFIFFQTFSSLSKIRGGKREYNKEKEEGREGKKAGGRKEEEERERETKMLSPSESTSRQLFFWGRKLESEVFSETRES